MALDPNDPNAQAYGSDPAYKALLDKYYPYFSTQGSEQLIDRNKQAFVDTFTNQVGRAPTPDEISKYYSQQLQGQQHLDWQDPYQLAQSYVPSAYGKDIQQNQVSKLPNLEKQISDLSSNVGAQTAKQLSDPNNPIYQSFSGQMNNLGISPSSGAFQAGLGGTVGNSATSTMQQLLSSLGGGAIGGAQSPSFQNLYGTGQRLGGGIQDQNQNSINFNLQAELAKQLADMGSPSGIQKDIGMASGAANALGGLGQGLGGLSAVTWICTAMCRHQVLGKYEVKRIHDHLFRAFFKRFRKFIGYFIWGKALVFLAERNNVNWEQWRPLFYDRVIAEPDPVKAVDLYEEAFWALFEVVRDRIRIKTLLLYDKPGVRHG